MTIATLTGHAIIAMGDKYSVRQKQMFLYVLQIKWLWKICKHSEEKKWIHPYHYPSRADVPFLSSLKTSKKSEVLSRFQVV